eukprot:TRINITY_DN9207_c0_g1_i2.p1 TRINITY_DN9207_c0_g1~~TRINITY_DN9207_c0_g1_i2.p1  ORF type:complete len:292 (-),score=53.46 TRINITY_DN9207_c0_g1_i2:526-1401(-)
MVRQTLRFCDEALALDPYNAKAHFRRGCALESLERFREAYLAYEAAAKLMPSDPRINQAFNRISCYDASELGEEIARGAERLRKVEAQKQKMRKARKADKFRQAMSKDQAVDPRIELEASLSKCCWCPNKVRGGDFYASPCGHGPFCGGCRKRIDEDGSGLSLCPVCRCSVTGSADRAVIKDWQKAPHEQDNPLQEMKNKTNEKRKAFGPRKPPDMYRDKEKATKKFPPRWRDSSDNDPEESSDNEGQEVDESGRSTRTVNLDEAEAKCQRQEMMLNEAVASGTLQLDNLD